VLMKEQVVLILDKMRERKYIVKKKFFKSFFSV